MALLRRRTLETAGPLPIPAYVEAIRTCRSVYGARPYTAVGMALSGLGNALFHEERHEDAEAAYREAIAVLRS